MMEDKPKTLINFHQMELDDRILKVNYEKSMIDSQSHNFEKIQLKI